MTAESNTLVEKPSGDEGAPLWIGIVNISASALGVGILSMPICMYYAGTVTGSIIIFIMGLMADASLYLIVRCAQLSKESTFPALGQACYGKQGHATVLLVLLSLLMGCSIGALLVVTQLAKATASTLLGLDPSHPYLHHLVVSAVVVALTFPLILLRNLSKLAPTSSAAVISLLYVAAVLVFSWLKNEDVPEGTMAFNWEGNIWAVPSIVTSAFVCQFNILPIYDELRPSSKANINTLIHTSMLGIAAPVYVLFGLAGYLQLGTLTSECSNVLLCFDSPIIRAGMVAIGMTNFLKYPLLVLPFRDTLNSLIFKGPVTFPTMVVEMIFFSGFVYLVAYALGDVGRVCALLGATSGTAIMYILPGAFYAKLNKEHVPDSLPQQIFGWAMAVIGVILMIQGVLTLP